MAIVKIVKMSTVIEILEISPFLFEVSINLGPTSAVPRPAGHLDPIGIDPAHLHGLALTQRELRGTTELR